MITVANQPRPARCAVPAVADAISRKQCQFRREIAKIIASNGAVNFRRIEDADQLGEFCVRLDTIIHGGEDEDDS